MGATNMPRGRPRNNSNVRNGQATRTVIDQNANIRGRPSSRNGK